MQKRKKKICPHLSPCQGCLSLSLALTHTATAGCGSNPPPCSKRAATPGACACESGCRLCCPCVQGSGGNEGFRIFIIKQQQQQQGRGLLGPPVIHSSSLRPPPPLFPSSPPRSQEHTPRPHLPLPPLGPDCSHRLSQATTGGSAPVAKLNIDPRYYDASRLTW